MFKDSKTLDQVSLTALPIEPLEQLKGLFELNLRLWKKERSLLEIVGSTPKNASSTRRLFRRLFPLQNAENIVIDGEHVRFVDFTKNKKINRPKSLRHRLYPYIEVVGSQISVAILNRMLAKKKDTVKSVYVDNKQAT
jgi:hypothetical protein